MEKAADVVTLDFEISAMDPEQPTANKQVQTQANKVFQLLAKNEIPESDIVASGISSSPEYEEIENSEKKGKLLGYRVDRTFTAKVKDLKKFPPLVDSLLEIKGLTLSGIREEYSKHDELADNVWDVALKDAKDRADKSAKASGMKVDSVYAISPIAFPTISSAMLGASGSEKGIMYEALRQDVAHYVLAPIRVTQEVHVIYLISPTEK